MERLLRALGLAVEVRLRRDVTLPEAEAESEGLLLWVKDAEVVSRALGLALRVAVKLPVKETVEAVRLQEGDCVVSVAVGDAPERVGVSHALWVWLSVCVGGVRVGVPQPEQLYVGLGVADQLVKLADAVSVRPAVAVKLREAVRVGDAVHDRVRRRLAVSVVEGVGEPVRLRDVVPEADSPLEGDEEGLRVWVVERVALWLVVGEWVQVAVGRTVAVADGEAVAEARVRDGRAEAVALQVALQLPVGVGPAEVVGVTLVEAVAAAVREALALPLALRVALRLRWTLRETVHEPEPEAERAVVPVCVKVALGVGVREGAMEPLRECVCVSRRLALGDGVQVSVGLRVGVGVQEGVRGLAVKVKTPESVVEPLGLADVERLTVGLPEGVSWRLRERDEVGADEADGEVVWEAVQESVALGEGLSDGGGDGVRDGDAEGTEGVRVGLRVGLRLRPKEAVCEREVGVQVVPCVGVRLLLHVTVGVGLPEAVGLGDRVRENDEAVGVREARTLREGVGLWVREPVRLGDAEGLGVGLRVAGVAVTEKVRERDMREDAVGDGVWDGVEVRLDEGLGEREWVWVEGVQEGLGMGLWLPVGLVVGWLRVADEAEEVEVGVRDSVGEAGVRVVGEREEVWVRVGRPVEVELADTEREPLERVSDAEADSAGDSVRVDVRDCVREGPRLSVGVGVRPGDTEAVCLGVTDAEAGVDALAVPDRVRVVETVDAVGLGEGVRVEVKKVLRLGVAVAEAEAVHPRLRVRDGALELRLWVRVAEPLGLVERVR